MVPGTYAIKLTAGGTVLAGTVEVLPDPRAKVSRQDLVARQAFALQLRDDITKLSRTVIALQEVRKQLQERSKLWADVSKAKQARTDTGELIKRLNTLEEKLHNPKAEVTYDILAMRGGAATLLPVRVSVRYDE